MSSSYDTPSSGTFPRILMGSNLHLATIRHQESYPAVKVTGRNLWSCRYIYDFVAFFLAIRLVYS